MKYRYKIFGILGIMVLLSNESFASPNIPATAESGRINEQILSPSLNKNNEIIPIPIISIQDDIPVSPDGFELKSVNIQGITAFLQNYFDDLIQEYIGLNVDIDTLNHLSARITQKYRDSGYFISRAIIPEQEVIDGAVTIIVIEGGVNEIDVQDYLGLLEKDSYCIFYRTAARIKKLDPLHGPSLERYILLLNDSNAVSINSTLSATKNDTEPGKVDVILEVNKNDPAQIISLNNYGSKFVGPYQLNGAYYDGGIFNSFDELSLNFTGSLPLKEVQFGSINYSLPLTPEGLKASYTLSYSNSEPGKNLRDLEVSGDSIIAKTELSYPVIRSRRQNLTVGSFFEFRQSSTEFLNEELVDDKTRSVSFFTNYKTLDDKGGDVNVLASISSGLNILNATETGSDNLSREQGRSDFLKGNFEASRKQITKNFEINTSLSAQYAPHPLLSAYEFGYGGIEYGRAYDPSEITGDNGVSAALEVRYTNINPVLSNKLRLVPFGFYDIGKIWNHDDGEKPQSAASAGVGTYFALNRNISGSLQVAVPLTKSISNPIMNGKDGPRILFNLSKQF